MEIETLMYIVIGLLVVNTIGVVYIAIQLSGVGPPWPHFDLGVKNALEIPSHTKVRTVLGKLDWDACMAEKTFRVQERILELLEERLINPLPGSHSGG
ncbi:MAG: hypothetical protein ACREOO_08310 [bacterium]